MILADLGLVTAYRMHTPRRATTPTSGAGAAAHGGRANRPGTTALYLSLDSATAIREYQQASPLMPPGTLVAYTVRVAPIVDFGEGFDPKRWAGLWEEFYCDWRGLWFDKHVEPPSWVLADEVLAAGAKGIRFASTVASGGFNLVLYNETLMASDLLEVYDPAGTLPKNQDSWK